MSRTYDLIVNGATGFTGTLVAHYLAKKTDLKTDSWAISGRDEAKLKALVAELTKTAPRLNGLKYLVANSNDYNQVVWVVKQAKVLINCVGPFVKYGEPVVKACVEQGTHYVDITGEPAFIKDIINKHHETAKQKGIIVIPAAGFDSIPADLSVLFAEKRKAKEELREASFYISMSGGGGISYGTYNTIIESLSNNAPKAVQSRAESNGKIRPKNIQRLIPHRSAHTNSWVFPFNFTSDPFVVTRSRRLSGKENFSFAEYLEVPSFVHAFVLAFVLFVFFLVIRIPGGYGATFLRSLRKEGSGPSEEVRKKSSTSARIFVVDANGKSSTARYFGPEGYEATAVIVAEAALAILEGGVNKGGGVTTAAVALGDGYIDRLAQTGLIKFE